MLSMVKSGVAKLPMDRVSGLARALGCDTARLFNLALEQQDPVLAAVVEANYGLVVTSNEAAWIKELRDASDHSDPTLTRKARRALRVLFRRDQQKEGRDAALVLTENEVAWIEFLRLSSRDSDPRPTLRRVQQLRRIFEEGNQPDEDR